MANGETDSQAGCDCGWMFARQDMIEYALLAASIAVVVAGFLPPAVMPGISTIFSKIVSGFNEIQRGRS